MLSLHIITISDISVTKATKKLYLQKFKQILRNTSGIYWQESNGRPTLKNLRTGFIPNPVRKPLYSWTGRGAGGQGGRGARGQGGKGARGQRGKGAREQGGKGAREKNTLI